MAGKEAEAGWGGGQFHFYFSIRLQNDVPSYARKFEERSLKKKMKAPLHVTQHASNVQIASVTS